MTSVTATDPAEAARRWFESQPSVPDLTVDQRELILSLVGNPAFGLFWSWMYSEQLGYHTQLANAHLKDASAAAYASVIQGKIHGLDRIKEAMIDLLQVPIETEKT